MLIYPYWLIFINKDKFKTIVYSVIVFNMHDFFKKKPLGVSNKKFPIQQKHVCKSIRKHNVYHQILKTFSNKIMSNNKMLTFICTHQFSVVMMAQPQDITENNIDMRVEKKLKIHVNNVLYVLQRKVLHIKTIYYFMYNTNDLLTNSYQLFFTIRKISLNLKAYMNFG